MEEGAHIVDVSLGFNFPGLVQWWTEKGMAVALGPSGALAEYRDNWRSFDAGGVLRARSRSALLTAPQAAGGTR